jgi:hypothetical protein
LDRPSVAVGSSKKRRDLAACVHMVVEGFLLHTVASGGPVTTRDRRRFRTTRATLLDTETYSLTKA